MKPSSILSNAAVLVALATFNPMAMATPINGAASGLNNPGVLITFDPPPTIAMNTAVTDQYASQGVTFDTLYYNPYDPDNIGQYMSINGLYLGNYQFTSDEDALPTLDFQPLTITFSSVQTRAAFGIESNGGDGDDSNGDLFTFTAFLDGAYVESFAASISDGYYGFTDSQFDSIVVTSCVPTDDNACVDRSAPQRVSFNAQSIGSQAASLVNPDFYLFDNLQFDPAVTNPAAVPEPEIAALFGLGLFGAAVMRRRSSRSRAE